MALSSYFLIELATLLVFGASYVTPVGATTGEVMSSVISNNRISPMNLQIVY